MGFGSSGPVLSAILVTTAADVVTGRRGRIVSSGAGWAAGLCTPAQVLGRGACGVPYGVAVLLGCVITRRGFIRDAEKFSHFTGKQTE